MVFDGNNIIAYLAGLIPIGAYLLKLVIDNWRATDLEKIMMSNFKKFQIGLTKYLLTGIAFAAFFYVYLTIVPPKEIKDMDSFILIILLVIIFTLTASAFFLLEKFMVFLLNVLSFKFDYYVVNDKNEVVFRVIKLSDKNNLLVESDGIEEFIDNPKEKRYKKVRRKNEKLREFYSGKKIYIVLFISFTLCLLTFVSVFKTESLVQFLLYSLSVLLLLLSIILLLNFLDEHKRIRINSEERS